MSGMIAAADINTVRERVRINEVVAEQVTLRNAGGGSMKGLCPFHEERTPSFHVTPAKGLYYCFGCGQGGDAIDFLMTLEHLSFTEAVEKLAARTGVTLRYEGGSAGQKREQGKRKALLAVNAAAAAYFVEQLQTKQAQHARKFLTERGFDREACADFGVGYAPRNGSVAHLRSQGFEQRDIVESGVAGSGEGRTYDRFRDRVVWPIRELSGDIVGFGARRLAEESGPKYLNTPETLVYKKSNVLFGAYQARKDIAKEQQVVVVEGYTDVMACHLAGISTAVATCGTAFGDGHVKVLRRLLLDDGNAQVVFTFDGDEAGRKAALRAYEEDQQFAGGTYVAIARDGLDPCDLRLRDGDEAVRELVVSRSPLFEFVLRDSIEGLNLGTAEGRSGALRAAAPILAGIKDELLRQEYDRQVAGWLGVEPAEVRAAAGASRSRAAAPTGRNSSKSAPPPRRPSGSGTGQWEWQALQVLVRAPDLVAEWLDSVDADAFADPRTQSLYAAVAAAGRDDLGSAQWLRVVMEHCEDDEERRLIGAMVAKPLPAAADGSTDQEYAIGIVARLLFEAAGRRAGDLRASLGSQETAEDGARTAAVLADLQELEAYRRNLRGYWAAVD